MKKKKTERFIITSCSCSDFIDLPELIRREKRIEFLEFENLQLYTKEILDYCVSPQVKKALEDSLIMKFGLAADLKIYDQLIEDYCKENHTP